MKDLFVLEGSKTKQKRAGRIKRVPSLRSPTCINCYEFPPLDYGPALTTPFTVLTLICGMFLVGEKTLFFFFFFKSVPQYAVGRAVLTMLLVILRDT